jgi:hypothetical protein
MNNSLVSAFNKQFTEFIDDIYRIFPENSDIQTARNMFSTIRMANPKLISIIWHKHITGPYAEVIERGDIDFFLNKDYVNDLASPNTDPGGKIAEGIDRLREPIKSMGHSNKQISMKYIQNLTKLSQIIHK